MIGSSDSFWNDHSDHFKDFHEKFEENHRSFERGYNVVSTIVQIGCGVVAVLVFITCIYYCCRRCSRNRGRIISPPPPVPPAPNAAYPRQQYAAPYPGAHHHTVVTSYPVSAAPYPSVTPYPPAPAPAPAPAVAPYPTGPYPSMPYPVTAPTAPDAHALPPTYEQAVGGERDKQPPYNPSAPL